MTEDHQQPACTQQKKCGLHSCLYCGWKPVTDADRIEALTAELARLRHCLKNANDKHEFYEREWYLRGDRIEALTAALVEIRACTTEYGGAAKALRIINAALEKQP